MPTYVKHGIIHYTVPNIPALMPRTATLALTNATLPYVLKIANLGYKKAICDDPALAQGVNVINGYITCKGVAEAFGLDYVPLNKVLN